MGKKDICEKNLEQYPDVFSDIVNALLYRGRENVCSEDLYPASTETFYQINGGWHQQFDDVSMYEYRNGNIYVQYIFENQTEEDRQMILRQTGYEGAVYRGQYERHEPFGVITLVLNWGERAWSSSVSLHKFLAGKNYPDGVKQYIENHVLHVFDMHHLPPEIRKRFRSDMRIVIDYLAEQEQYKPTNQAIKHLDAFLFMMQSLTGDDRFEKILEQIKDKEKDGGITMCELIDRYWNAGLNEGIVQGVTQGIAQGIIQLLLCHGAIPGQLQERIQEEKDINILKSWIVLAAKAATIEEFETNM